MLKEFKTFIMRGNVLDLAIAVVIGGAFGAIVSSLVKDIITPLLGLMLGGVDFTSRFLSLDGQTYASLEAAQEAGAAVMTYGIFIQAIIDFLVIAFVIFMVVRTANRLQKEEPQPEAAPTTKECPYCLSVIPIKATRCAHCTSQLSD